MTMALALACFHRRSLYFDMALEEKTKKEQEKDKEEEEEEDSLIRKK